jgi:hypothetical protein
MFKVVPFQAAISHYGTMHELAASLQIAIDLENADGWDFVQLQELTTWVDGSSGCFGIGAVSGHNRAIPVLIFKRR